jgi:predicted O-methyltransferase YrrM
MEKIMLPSANGVCDLLPKDKNIVGIEIGCQEAISSDYFLNELPNLKLYSIDPYKEYTDWHGGIYAQHYQDSLFNHVGQKLSKFKDRFLLLRMTSDTAIRAFLDDSVDFIFIDGLHTYDQVLKDCKNYYPKLKSGGLISGHDYNAIEAVRKAVDEFAQIEQKNVNFTPSEYQSDVWYWIK